MSACVHHLVKHVVDELGPMLENEETGRVEAAVVLSHHECVECGVHVTVKEV